MNRCGRAIVSCCLILPALATLTTTPPAAAQESVGFAAPGDLRALLDYRLPDWGYRTWDAAFDFAGNGSSSHGNAGPEYAGRHTLSLRTDLDWQNEGERRSWWCGGSIAGSYLRYHAGDEDQVRDGHNLDDSTSCYGGILRYLGDGPFSVTVSGRVGMSYMEAIAHVVSAGQDTELGNYWRSRRISLSPGVGVGRVRNVTPLLRAQRLSERLTALGRPALTREQVQRVAEVLAREQGYRQVYERPDRSFWRDVLEPMLDPARPLEPYEIFYLRDVLAEDLGDRRQGQIVSCGALYEAEADLVFNDAYESEHRGVWLSATAARNLSLVHQVSASVWANWSHGDTDRGDIASGRVTARLVHLWSLADRVLVTTAGTAEFSYYERPGDGRFERGCRGDMGSDMRFRVEDSAYLVAGVHARYLYRNNASPANGPVTLWQDGWNWEYRVALDYVLDRFLY